MMNQVIEFFKKLLDSSDWPPRWHCGKWTEFHGWLYIVSDLLIWSAYFAIPVVIIKYISKKQDPRFVKLYFLFAAFILACGATHFLDAVAFWIPVYRLNALVRFITGVISWVTVFYIIKYLPIAFSLRPQHELELEIVQRKKAEEQVKILNAELEKKVIERTATLKKSNERFDLITKATNDILWDWDLVNNKLWWNENYYKQFGYDKETSAANADAWNNSIHPADKDRVLQSFHHIIDTGQHYWSDEYRFLKADGIVVDILDRGYVLFDEGGKAYRMVGAMQDITERKRAEAEIEKSEHRFRNTLDKMLEGVQIIGFDWRYIYVNDAMAKHGKYAKEELIGYTVMEKYPGIEQTEIFKVYQRCFKERVSIHLENEFLYPDHSSAWFELSFQPVPEGLFILSVDISARKKAEQSLRRSEARFRTLIENSNDIIAITDEKFKTFYRSPSSARITGWTPGEREQGGSIEQTHPDDMPVLKQKIEQTFQQPGIPIPVSFRTRHKKGHYIWLEGFVTNLLQEESVNGIVTNLSDVTEKKIAEERLIRSEEIYRTIASSIPGSVICLLDTDYRYLLIEGDMLEKIGYLKEELLGNKTEDVLSPDNYARALPNLVRVFQGETFTTETSGIGYDIVSRYVPLKDENKNVYSAMVVLFDVSELKNAQRHISELNAGLEQKVTERTRQLEEANKELESFSYSVSHDLRAPLRAISGYSTILIEDYSHLLDAEGKRIADLIVASSKRMGNLIDDLLNFSRMGRKELTPALVNMQAMVQSALAELLPDDAANKYVIHVNTLPDAEADPAMIKQVWLNLIDNALKYSSKKEKSEIEIGFTEDPVNHIYFIKDNGAGFDMQYAHKLFGVFQRLHRSSEFAGTGVGLALAKRVIQKHHGDIWATAAENEGATFYFSLPKKFV